MIIIKIHGGLGNQMFQYAFGRTLALKNACELKLDISFFNDQDLRQYDLKHYAIEEGNIASWADCERLITKHNSRWGRWGRKYLGYSPNFVEESNLTYNQAYLNLKDECFFNGYWQSEKYFIDIADIIRREFKLNAKSSAPNLEIKKKIELSNAVSLHIRRGDFETNRIVNDVHGICSLEYYHQAIRFIAGQTNNPVFFVFSDDIPWAKGNLITGFETYFIDANDQYSAHEDMALMSCCDHNIIANSTFSWWGAWLNANPDKIVIAPRLWFADKTMNLQSEQIVPEKWIKL